MQRETLSGRELEAAVLTRAAMMLRACQDSWQGSDSDNRLSDALKYNQMVWSIFQAELMSPDNPLPPEIRQNILNLSLFIDKRTFDLMAYPAPEKLTVIININLNLAAGLTSTAAIATP
ncbi:MAG TPA: flagellar biosynthesis regulator FlaF [Geobacterales bacterium]|jgi:flagellar protein FlaF|nr:flagellar biosynthesis regulator FlaF [Geobacterales bacterium]